MGSRWSQQQDGVGGERRLEIACVTAADFLTLRINVPLAGARVIPADSPCAARQMQAAGSGGLGHVGQVRLPRVRVWEISNDDFLAGNDLDGVAVVSAHRIVRFQSHQGQLRLREKNQVRILVNPAWAASSMSGCHSGSVAVT